MEEAERGGLDVRIRSNAHARTYLVTWSGIRVVDDGADHESQLTSHNLNRCVRATSWPRTGDLGHVQERMGSLTARKGYMPGEQRELKECGGGQCRQRQGK